MPKHPFTIDKINAMTDEEVKALNAKLGRQVLLKFGGLMLVKWALVFGSVHLAKKWVRAQGVRLEMEHNDAGD
jgi:hypothetical protein